MTDRNAILACAGIVTTALMSALAIGCSHIDGRFDDLRADIGALREDIQSVDDRVHAHVTDHPSQLDQLLELSALVDPDPTRRVEHTDLLRFGSMGRQP